MKRNLILSFLILCAMLLLCIAPAHAQDIPTMVSPIDLTPILQAVIALLAALVTAKVIPWIKSKTTAQQQATLSMVVDVLVYAAEQVYGSDKAKEKLDYVSQQLEKRGYTVDIAQIEAAVRRMNEKNGKKTHDEIASSVETDEDEEGE